MKMRSLLTLFICILLCTSTVSAQLIHHYPNQALVQLTENTNLRSFEKGLQSFEGAQTNFRVVRILSKQINAYLVQFDHTQVNEVRFRAEIARQPEVMLAQVNHILTKRDTPNDTNFSDQWHWFNDGQTGGTVDADIDATEAWDISTGGLTSAGHEIVVAVYDDGGDLDHPDLMANNWINVDEIPDNDVDDDGNGYVDDVYGYNFGNNSPNVDNGGHGVNVAGMIGAVGNNETGAVGANWNVKIMNLITSGLNEASVVEFYSYALNERQIFNESGGARGSLVVATNSSWGLDFADASEAPIWCGFYDTLGEAGILNCGATSNQNVDIDEVSDLPTGCPSDFMLSVTATNHNDERTFSGYGLETVDFGAPGEDVYTTANGGGYTTTSGTSFASPTTAGVIALLYSAPCPLIGDRVISEPQAVALEIRSRLFEGVDVVPNLVGETVTGGRINAFNSLSAIMDNCGPCPPPSSLALNNTSDIQTDLTWSNPADALSADLRYRMVGATDWTDVSNATAPYTMIGLSACTEYEVQIEASCSEEMSGYSNSFVFTTEGCCSIPEDILISEVQENGANLTWTGILAASGYTITLDDFSGDVEPQIFTTTGTSFSFDGLDGCTEYELAFQSNCAIGDTEITQVVNFTTLGCGACIDLSYCETDSDNVTEEWIAHVQFAGIDNETPDSPDSGYSNFTGIATEVETYGIYDISLSPGYGGQQWPEFFTVFIDYDQSGTFENNEIVFEHEDSVDETITGSVTIPADATLGITRMRVSMKWQEPSTPCENLNYGEIEDYCLNIIPGSPTCDPPSSLDVESFDETTADLSWSETALGESYTVTVTNSETGEANEFEAEGTSFQLSDLSECSSYDIQVTSLCAEQENSELSESVNIFTLCQCDDVSQISPDEIIETAATFTWTSVSNGDTYDIRYREKTTSNWTEVSTSDLTITIDELEVCTDYEIQFKAICPNTESDFGPSFDFTTVCFPIGITRINTLGIAYYPTPFTSEVNIDMQLEKDSQFTLEVFDTSGKRVHQTNFELSTGQQVARVKNLAHLESGVYIFQLSNEETSFAQKLIKQ